jgi:hypothetical protein
MCVTRLGRATTHAPQITRHTPLKSRANKQQHLSGTNESFVDTKEALALELDDGTVLHVAKSRLSHSERRLAAVRVDEVLHVFALKTRQGRVGERFAGMQRDKGRMRVPPLSSFWL